MKSVNNFGVVWMLNKIEQWSKTRVRFLFILLFSREREIEMLKNFCKRANFSVHLRLFKTVFIYFFCLIILYMTFYFFRVILIVTYLFPVIHMNLLPFSGFSAILLNSRRIFDFCFSFFTD